MEAAQRAGSLVAEQIRAITQAAEAQATEIRREADEHAKRVGEESRREANGILERIDELETAIQQVVVSLRREADAVSALLERSQSPSFVRARGARTARSGPVLDAEVVEEPEHQPRNELAPPEPETEPSPVARKPRRPPRRRSQRHRPASRRAEAPPAEPEVEGPPADLEPGPSPETDTAAEVEPPPAEAEAPPADLEPDLPPEVDAAAEAEPTPADAATEAPPVAPDVEALPDLEPGPWPETDTAAEVEPPPAEAEAPLADLEPLPEPDPAAEAEPTPAELERFPETDTAAEVEPPADAEAPPADRDAEAPSSIFEPEPAPEAVAAGEPEPTPAELVTEAPLADPDVEAPSADLETEAPPADLEPSPETDPAAELEPTPAELEPLPETETAAEVELPSAEAEAPAADREPSLEADTAAELEPSAEADAPPADLDAQEPPADLESESPLETDSSVAPEPDTPPAEVPGEKEEEESFAEPVEPGDEPADHADVEAEDGPRPRGWVRSLFRRSRPEAGADATEEPDATEDPDVAEEPDVAAKEDAEIEPRTADLEWPDGGAGAQSPLVIQPGWWEEGGEAPVGAPTDEPLSVGAEGAAPQPPPVVDPAELDAIIGPALAPGAVVEDYRIEGVIGRQSGDAIVYAATQLSTGEPLALKMLPEAVVQDGAGLERFMDDAARQAALDHPGIVRTRGGEMADAAPFLVMDLVSGTTLKNLLVFHEVGGREALELLEPVAEALDLAASMGLPHRDLGPHKIIVVPEPEGRAMLGDFGAGRPPRTSDDTGGSETLDYAAPEQLRGEPATAASNVYSLAVILFECFVGSPPSAEGRSRTSTSGVEPEALPTDLPDELDRVLRRAMSEDPDQRVASAGELLRDAREALGQEADHTTSPPA